MHCIVLIVEFITFVIFLVVVYSLIEKKVRPFRTNCKEYMYDLFRRVAKKTRSNSLSLFLLTTTNRGHQEIEGGIEVEGPNKRRKTSHTPLAAAEPPAASISTTATEPPLPKAWADSLQDCYGILDQALKLGQDESERSVKENRIHSRKMCRKFKLTWVVASVLDERLHRHSVHDASLRAPLFLAQVAYVQAAALHHLAPFADRVSEIVISSKPTTASLPRGTSFVTKQRRFDHDRTDDPQDFSEAAMRYYDAAVSEFKRYRNQKPPGGVSKVESSCWELLISIGRTQCLCEINGLSRPFETYELSVDARDCRDSFSLTLRQIFAGTYRRPPSCESASSWFSPRIFL